MAVIMGKQGYIYTAVGSAATSAAVSCNAWSLDAAADAIDVTAFGTGTAIAVKSFDYGLKSATGSISGDFNDACSHIDNILNIMADGTLVNVDLALYATATHYYTCSALVTGATLGMAVADKVTFTINFTVDGTLTWTAA
jgi:hypothetical protein